MKRFAMTLIAMTMATAAFANTPDRTTEALAKKVRRELVTLPFLSVFGNLSFSIENDRVVLQGQVIRPTLRSSAENVVKRIEGVTGVVNNIEVLPLSNFDNQLRLAVFRAVYGNVVLNRYALNPNPSIRIVVKNGNVTLEGVVASPMDGNVAFIAANGVHGVFQVTNNLRVENARL